MATFSGQLVWISHVWRFTCPIEGRLMKDPQEKCDGSAPATGEATEKKSGHRKDAPSDTTRRSFLGKVGIGGAAAVALAAVPFEPLIEGKHGEAEASVVDYSSKSRANDSWNYRKTTAQNEKIDVGELPDNGDIHHFTITAAIGASVSSTTRWASRTGLPSRACSML